MRRVWPVVMLLFLFAHGAQAAPPLQLFVALTPAGGTLRPPPGVYSGPVTIDKPMTLDGEGKVVLDGGGDGTVLTISADGVTLRGLKLINSGDSFDQVDAGILLKADHCLVENNQVDQVLFGIHLQGANENTIRGNRIRSRGEVPSLRGEGIRLWYSHDNLIEDNRIRHVRDMVLANSESNRIIANRISDSRIGMELVFSPQTVIADNTLFDNREGILVLNSNAVKLTGNRFEKMRDFASAALAIKDSSQVVVENNEIIHNAMGMLANSPTHPENILYLRNNRFAYNDVALYFYGEKGGHVLHGNRFDGNIVQVAVSAPSSARDNDWRGNHWDDYRGFDKDGDGQGDTPYRKYLYSDRLWMERPMTRFFRASPVLEMVDFVERLAPLSPPALILEDPAPDLR